MVLLLTETDWTHIQNILGGIGHHAPGLKPQPRPHPPQQFRRTALSRLSTWAGSLLASVGLLIASLVLATTPAQARSLPSYLHIHRTTVCQKYRFSGLMSWFPTGPATCFKVVYRGRKGGRGVVFTAVRVSNPNPGGYDRNTPWTGARIAVTDSVFAVWRPLSHRSRAHRSPHNVYVTWRANAATSRGHVAHVTLQVRAHTVGKPDYTQTVTFAVSPY